MQGLGFTEGVGFGIQGLGCRLRVETPDAAPIVVCRREQGSEISCCRAVERYVVHGQSHHCNQITSPGSATPEKSQYHQPRVRCLHKNSKNYG